MCDLTDAALERYGEALYFFSYSSTAVEYQSLAHVYTVTGYTKGQVS